MTLFNSDRKKA